MAARGDGGSGSGSGWVGVAPVDSWGQGAHFGGKISSIGAILSKIRWMIVNLKKKEIICVLSWKKMCGGSTGGSGWVGVVPVDSPGHGAHFGGGFNENKVLLAEMWSILWKWFFWEKSQVGG
jgi:hypothetical protein